jgi:hypothetical protein
MTQRLVTVDDACVQTALVQINQVTIGGRKKMDQKTFRQVKEEQIINFDKACLNGKPWGFVNYFWKENEHYRDSHCLHLMWQKESELRRCFIDPDGYEDEYGTYIIGKEDKLLQLNANSNDFHNDIFHLDIIFRERKLKSLCELVNVEIPEFEIVPIPSFREKMEDFLKKWKYSSHNWYNKVYVDGEYITCSSYFWKLIRENFPEANQRLEDMSRVARAVIEPAYRIYMHNHVHPCNRLIKEIIKTYSQQLYV